MATSPELTLHVTCGACGRVHAVAVSARAVDCPCGETFDPATRPTVADPLLGRLVDGYRIEAIIGRGAIGSVYRAEQASLRRAVALKVLPPNFADDPRLLRRFHREASKLASLSHPHIVQVFDRGEIEGRPYLALELAAGETLRDRLRKGPLPAREAIRIAASICDALDYAHAKGVLHRDLRPENVIVTKGGAVKVADFGLAEAAARETVSHVHAGAYEYLAPEQRANPSAGDARADLFSTAVVLYEMLTGELPIGHFELPAQKQPELDARLDDILERGLAPSPRRRYAQAGEMARELRALFDDGERLLDVDAWVDKAKGAWERLRTRPKRASTSDERVRAFRRRRREAVARNEEVRSFAKRVGIVSIVVWLLTGLLGGIALLAGLVWGGLALLNRRMESGDGLQANATLWNVFSPCSREGARRARQVCRDARALRRRGLSIS
ncbi:MAG: serine/threonine-protein kinase [Planctomycetota bacterium]